MTLNSTALLLFCLAHTHDCAYTTHTHTDLFRLSYYTFTLPQGHIPFLQRHLDARENTLWSVLVMTMAFKSKCYLLTPAIFYGAFNDGFDITLSKSKLDFFIPS